MKVSLVSVTEGINTISSEHVIVDCARVSNPANQGNHDTAPRLIAYLIKNKHWSPFEMADMTVRIETSRAIAQQILRHRSFSFQEFSQRYAEVTEMEPVQIRMQAEKNRQSSTEVFDPRMNDFKESSITASDAINDHLRNGQDLYKALLDKGVAKECARFVLPLTTQTTIYMKGSVRSWIHYLQIRTDAHVQLEHQQVALAIKVIFDDLFPSIAEALAETPLG